MNKPPDPFSESETTMFTITEDWIAQSVNIGALTHAQADVLKIPWPLAKGWKHSVIGKEITAEQKTLFEAALSKRAKQNVLLYGTPSPKTAKRLIERSALHPAVQPENHKIQPATPADEDDDDEGVPW